MGTVKACLLFFSIQILYIISAREMKRVPDGFVGTRGKKSMMEIQSNMDHFFKRKPQFFVGVKGKKSLAEALAEAQYKRAPMGFVGMRGKKESTVPDIRYSSLIPKLDGSLVGKIDYSANDDMPGDATYNFRNMITEYLQAFEKENTLENELQQMANPQPSEELDADEMEKRAANMRQFYGVRGKKSMQNKRPYDLTFRGKFIGVRGKKDAQDIGGGVPTFLLDQEAPWPKRKTQMGFFGMRGKKWIDESSPETEEEVLN